jgi:phage tail sheath protein FI
MSFEQRFVYFSIRKNEEEAIADTIEIALRTQFRGGEFIGFGYALDENTRQAYDSMDEIEQRLRERLGNNFTGLEKPQEYVSLFCLSFLRQHYRLKNHTLRSSALPLS